MTPVSIVGLIPARGGSRGIPRKNLVDLGGKPLIAWSIEIGLRCDILDEVVVTTDDEEIAEVAEKWGARVPGLRPAMLASDDATDDMLYRYVVDGLFADAKPDLLVWLRPTSPFRNQEDVAGAVEEQQTTGATTVRSVCRVREHPYWMKVIEGNRLLPVIGGKDERAYPRRQLLPDVYRLNGAVEVFEVAKAGVNDMSIYEGEVGGFVMPRERSLDIDTIEDLERARSRNMSGPDRWGGK